MSMIKSKQLGRGHGSFRVKESERTPQKGRSFSKLKREAAFNPHDYVTAQCSERDVQIFKQTFDFLDDDHDGMLVPLDLRKTIKQYGNYNPGKAFVYIAMSVFDIDDGGEITFKEFVKLMTEHPCQNDTTEDILKVFDTLDDGHKEYISDEDILAVAQELKQNLTMAEVKEMIRYCDPKGDGVIRKQAFLAFNKRRVF